MDFPMKKNLIVIHCMTVLMLFFLNKATFAEPANIARLMVEVQNYHDSGAYLQELNQVIQQAQKFMIKRVKENASSEHHEKLAIVLDIDETSLSNYKNIEKQHFVSDREKIHQAILAGDAPAIEPMLAFYNQALKEGVDVFFVTGRPASDREVTIKNLKNAGYHRWAGLYLRPGDYKESSIIPFKSSIRKAISKKGYTIIESIGDQKSDIMGGYTEKGFKLPNPYYYIP